MRETHDEFIIVRVLHGRMDMEKQLLWVIRAFIKIDFPDLFIDAQEAEQLTFVSPKAAAIFCRSALENAINWLHENDKKSTRPWRTDLSTLLHEHEFRSLFNQTLFGELNLIRKTGATLPHMVRR